MTVYAEYYEYNSVEVYEWPTVNAAAVGTPLSDIELVGGRANVLGYFKWANPEETVYKDGEYIVMFVPFVTGASAAETLMSVPIATEVLESPELSISGGVASWGKVENASGYVVEVNGKQYEVDLKEQSFELPTLMDEYFVSVSAKGDGVNTVTSEASNIERYVPEKPKLEDTDYGKAKSEYNEDGEMVKYGGTTPIRPDLFDIDCGPNVKFEEDYILFDITVDVADYIKSSTQKAVLALNNIGLTTEVEITLHAQVKILNPAVYAEINLDFPFSMKDLAFGVEYTSMVTTIVDVSVNGEFVEPEQRRGTLHLLFIDLIGLEEPLYKWDKAVFRLMGTPIAVEFALCFDAVGAIAADAYLKHVEVADYSAGIVAIENGNPVFVPYYSKEIKSNVTEIELDGELDVSLNCVRLSASLQLTTSEENTISVVRLNLDAANITSDLSGKANVTYDASDGNVETETDLNGAYRFFGQITFEYYFEIRLSFSFLPLDDFSIKLLDSSYILAEWEYLKGGLPKTPYMDEAIHNTTPIFATDNKFDYIIGVDGTLSRSEIGKDLFLAKRFADFDTEEIVDIDDYYIYVLSGTKLRRVGRVAGTERTILVDVARVLGSDRNYIYYTSKNNENKIEKLYRSDIESDEPTFVKLPAKWQAIRMRYDHLNECYVIYAERGAEAAYFTYTAGGALKYHGANEHKWWDNTVF
jgi:hypothetical protein